MTVCCSAERLGDCVPVGSLPTLRQDIVFYLQSSTGAESEIIGKLSCLRELGEAQGFVFIYAITAAFVFDTKIDLVNHTAFEPNFPDVRVGCCSDRSSPLMAARSSSGITAL